MCTPVYFLCHEVLLAYFSNWHKILTPAQFYFTNLYFTGDPMLMYVLTLPIGVAAYR